jgi:Ca2+-binding RTX toxin-like protein
MTTDLYSKLIQGHNLDADSIAFTDTAWSLGVRAPELIVARNDFALSADTFVGTSGNDTFQVDDAADVVIEAANGGTDRIYASVSYTLPDNVEILELEAGAQSLKGVGNGLNNLIESGAGNDTLDGGIGADTLWGGVGNDTYFVDNANDVVQEISTNAGVDTVYSSVSYALASDVAVERLVLTGTADLNATGNQNTTLVGNSGANVLTGSRTMEGGAGNDTYVNVFETSVLVEKAGGGTDTVIVREPFSYVLPQYFENLTMQGEVYRGTGNSAANVITGNGSDNWLDGAGGADTLVGGDGSDQYFVDQAGDKTVENAGPGTDHVHSSINWTLSANTEDLTLTGVLSINGGGNILDNQLVGNDANNELIGYAGADTLLGDQGNDMLNGGSGADRMEGGMGDDIYYVDDAGDSVFDYNGTDTIRASISYTLTDENVENLILIGSAAINGTGNGGLNHIIGNSADNVLDDGGHVAGVDTLQGGLGNDRYILRDGGMTSVIVEGVNGGTDTVVSSGSATLAANVENLELDDDFHHVLGRGNDLANKITVLGEGWGNDTLDGGRGADTLSGGIGSDTYVVDNVGDKLIETANGDTDLVQSSVSYTLQVDFENLTLTGSAAINGTGNSVANELTGNAANNTLDGGLGTDTMIGGAGNDTYVVQQYQDRTYEAAGGGTDTVLSSASVTLQDNVENLRLTGTAVINGNGNALANALTGNSATNVLDGKAGSDKLTGGAGADIFALSSMLGSDVITDFAHGVDKLRLSQAAIRVGDGDTLVENAVSLAGPNGFNTSAELVVVTHDISGSITAASAATAIGHANSNYAAGDTRLFVVDNGDDSAVYLFKSADANSTVSASELTLLATLDNSASTTVTDYVFGV